VLPDGVWLELESAAEQLKVVSGRLGQSVVVDIHEVLNHRGLAPQGAVSANGSCRLLPTKDGWVALTLNRPDDWDLLPALFRTDDDDWDWETVAEAAAATTAEQLESAAIELGLAAAAVPAEPPEVDQPWRVTLTSGSGTRPRLARVVDLSALWAGPLCASLLHRVGADVLTVESTARRGGTREYEAGELISLDFSRVDGRAELHRLVQDADVVITAARQRALANLGLDPVAVTRQCPGLTWVGISAYGLTGPMANRIGYGDDTAVAGGLVVREPSPRFVGDAIADPITGLYAAIAALEVAAAGGGVVDIALRDAAAFLARASL